MRVPQHLSLTACRQLASLDVVDGLPGGGAELTPHQLSALDAALLRIADSAESQLLQRRGKPLLAECRAYPQN